MRVLVTGAGGFLGRPLLHALASAGNAHALDGDVTNAATFAGAGPADVVYHLAAQSNVPLSVKDPASTWKANVDGTLQMLEWARRDQVSRVILVSSSHVYGHPVRAPMDEGHPLQPRSPYGASKLAAEALAQAYHATYGVATVVVRPFNIYGPGQSPGFLVPDILGQLRTGKDLVLGDPKPVRDYTFLDDAVRFLVACGSAAGIAGQALNLGSGQGHSVQDVVEAAVRAAGSRLVPTFDPGRFRANESGAVVADVAKARRLLGWSPRIGLEDGLRRTWAAG
ncbi:MAG: GDP-mannose 4,6-dehydratase [Candidatus Thermoplasmatota archaeon]|jgi:nucleoside-diphosphate-sugar epimerase